MFFIADIPFGYDLSDRIQWEDAMTTLEAMADPECRHCPGDTSHHTWNCDSGHIAEPDGYCGWCDARDSYDAEEAALNDWLMDPWS